MLIDNAELVRISRVSTSRQNFSANLNCRIFSREERAVSNVAGVLGKSKLDPKRVDYIEGDIQDAPFAGSQGKMRKKCGAIVPQPSIK